MSDSYQIAAVVSAEKKFQKLVNRHQKTIQEDVKPEIPTMMDQTYVKERDFGRDTLLQAWNQFPVSQKRLFRREFGDWEELMSINVHFFMISALIQHWDPVYKVFTFGNFDLTPTIEEYSDLIQISRGEKNLTRIYEAKSKSDYVTSLSQCTAVPRTFWEEHKSIVEGIEGWDWNHIEKWIFSVESWGHRRTILALGIFCKFFLPVARGRIDVGAVKVFLAYKLNSVNFVPVILAETLRALTKARSKKQSTLNCCVHLLQIWIYSHIHPHRHIIHPSFEGSDKWGEEKINRYIGLFWEGFDKGFWIIYLQRLSESDITWKAPYIKVRAVIVGAQEFNHLPLIGARGVVTMAPTLVMRQFALPQFIPSMFGLWKFDFDFEDGISSDLMDQAASLWKNLRYIQMGIYTKYDIAEYRCWRDTQPRHHQPLRIRENFLVRFHELINKNPKEIYQTYLERIQYARCDPHTSAIDEYLAGPSKPQLSQPTLPPATLDHRVKELELELVKIREENVILASENSSYKIKAQQYDQISKEVHRLQEENTGLKSQLSMAMSVKPRLQIELHEQFQQTEAVVR